MRSYWNRAGLQSNTASVLVKRENVDTDVRVGRTPCEDEAEIGETRLQIEQHRELARGLRRIVPRSLGRNQPAGSSVLDSWPPGAVREQIPVG